MSKMVPYHEMSIQAAREMTKDDATAIDKYRTITHFLTKEIKYDHIRAATIPKKNGVPDVPRTWDKRMGICLDTAALATGMLRAVGIRAWMCFGRADKANHAWVEAEIGGRRLRYDHDGKAKSYKTERMY